MSGDDDLMRRLRERDPAVFADLQARFVAELKLFCRHMVFDAALAEDIVQEVMMRCARIEPAQLPTGSLRGWLYRVARNKCIDELRRMKPEVRLTAMNSAQTFMPGVAAIDSGSTPAARAVKADRARQVQLVVDSLDDDLRAVVIMHFFQNLSNAEVAEALDLSVSGAKARLSRATRLLREKLSRLDDSRT